MKTELLLFIAMLSFSAFAAYAQPTKVLRVKNGKDATRSIPAKDRFEYKDFQYGKLNYKNGNYAQTRLNYCYLLGEVMYINQQGDTLLIADNNAISYAEIGKDIFYPDAGNGYLAVVADCGVVLLAKKEQYKIGGNEKHGAYQSQNENGAVYNAANFTDINGVSTQLQPNNTVLLRPTLNYFLLDINKRSYKANRASFLKIFAKHKAEVDSFLNEEHIDFTKEDDLKKAIRFCSERMISDL
jgi:hypothetical protein